MTPRSPFSPEALRRVSEELQRKVPTGKRAYVGGMASTEGARVEAGVAWKRGGVGGFAERQWGVPGWKAGVAGHVVF